MIEFMDKNILRREAINKRNELSLEIKSKYDNLILKKVIIIEYLFKHFFFSKVNISIYTLKKEVKHLAHRFLHF